LGHSITIVKKKLIYLFGGWDGTVMLNDLMIYNISESIWKKVKFENLKELPCNFFFFFFF
jgi:hypothetical protein